MICTSVVVEWFHLLREADEAELRNENVEPYLIRALESVRSRPDCRHEYVSAFKSLIASDLKAPWETLPFCMHELRWPEVEAAVVEQLDAAIKASDWRIINTLAAYRDSFSDDWEGWVQFDYYSVRVGRPRPE